jgi:outer membrane protein assembly factor BamB
MVLESAGFDRGLCLVIGDHDGNVTAALAKAGRLYVQGCTWEAEGVGAGRNALAAAGVADRASLAWIEGEGLPYADSLVNVVVSAHWTSKSPTVDEVLRVLAPGGLALLGSDSNPALAADLATRAKAAKAKDVTASSRKGWIQFSKAVHPGFDVWTHNQGGADLSFVNADKRAGPWAEARWIADPRWGALGAVYHGRVTAGGRLYYNENRTAAGGGTAVWLVARDAWNGSELWRVPIGSPPKYGNMGSTLTCDDHRVYCVEDNTTLTARDGRTGRKVREYSPGFRPTFATCARSTLLVCDLGIAPAVATKVVALDKDSGKVLWARPGITQPPAENGTVFVLTATEIEGVELATGVSRWKVKAETAPGIARAFCRAGVVYVAYTPPWKPMGLLVAYNGKNGSLLWKKESPACNYGALPYADEFWMLQYVNTGGKGDSLQVSVLDPRSGTVTREFRAKGTVNNKCYPAKGSADCLLYSNSWTLDRKSGATLAQDTVRSPCSLGQMPANGMTYYLPQHCDCGVYFRGMLAMSRPGERQWLPDGAGDGSPRLFTAGPAPPPLTEGAEDWPMYRRDTARSNCTATKLPRELKPLWSEKLAASRLTQAVVADGRVCTTDPQGHRVFALDVASGKGRWSFVADGRTDWAPTLHRGLCIFSTGAGSVYALDARSGKEIWRLRAAPAEKYIAEEGQFASAWPVIGGVMALGGELFFAGGRARNVDNGMWLFAADPATGKIRWRVRGGSSGDLLTSDGKDLMLTKTFYRIADGARIGGSKKAAGLLHTTHYYSPVSVLDYMACVEPLLSSEKHIELTDGRIVGENLAFSDKLGVAAWRYRFGVSADMMKKNKPNQRFLYAKAEGKNRWLLDENISQQMVGVVLAGETACLAGLPTSLDPKDKGELWVLSGADGRKLQVLPLDSWPVYDGLSAANDRLYLAGEDGRFTCLGAK